MLGRGLSLWRFRGVRQRALVVVAHDDTGGGGGGGSFPTTHWSMLADVRGLSALHIEQF